MKKSCHKLSPCFFTAGMLLVIQCLCQKKNPLKMWFTIMDCTSKIFGTKNALNLRLNTLLSNHSIFWSNYSNMKMFFRILMQICLRKWGMTFEHHLFKQQILQSWSKYTWQIVIFLLISYQNLCLKSVCIPVCIYPSVCIIKQESE